LLGATLLGATLLSGLLALLSGLLALLSTTLGPLLGAARGTALLSTTLGALLGSAGRWGAALLGAWLLATLAARGVGDDYRLRTRRVEVGAGAGRWIRPGAWRSWLLAWRSGLLALLSGLLALLSGLLALLGSALLGSRAVRLRMAGDGLHRRGQPWRSELLAWRSGLLALLGGLLVLRGRWLSVRGLRLAWVDYGRQRDDHRRARVATALLRGTVWRVDAYRRRLLLGRVTVRRVATALLRGTVWRVDAYRRRLLLGRVTVRRAATALLRGRPCRLLDRITAVLDGRADAGQRIGRDADTRRCRRSWHARLVIVLPRDVAGAYYKSA
jgi:hypothetical protein